ncbi:ketoacyl-synthetase C-terminal extension domain-containing protein, partial [Brevibacillus laterosporus]
SSFGFSGTNAHMVIEEAPYVGKASESKPGYLITLSARTQDQLHQQVKRLIQYCEHKDQIDYGNMSYTLLMGRKHCNHRLACVVHEQNELVDALKKWIEKGEASEVYASVLDKKEQQEQIAMKQYGNEYIRKLTIETDGSAYIGHLSTLAALYTQGYELEFDQMFLQNHYSRISLPTYPFAKERYWIPEEDDQIDNRKHIGKITLEPVWKEQEITQRERVPNYHQHIVMLCEPFVHVRDQLVAQTNGITFISLHSENTRLEQRFESYAVQAFETVQQIVQSKPEGNVLI